MVSEAAKQQVEDACGTMQACLEMLRGRPDASAPRPTREQLAGAVQQLRMEVAKLGLLYNAPSPPGLGDSNALLCGLQRSAGGVCLLLTGAAARGGPTLRHSVHTAAERLVGACMDLVQGAVLEGARDEELMRLVGRCMEQCNAVAKAPLDNKTAIGRAITQVLKTMADASRELQEIAAEADEAEEAGAGNVAGERLAEEPAAANGAGSGAQISDDDEDEGGEDEDADLACEALTSQQARVVRSVHAVLGAVMALLKSVVRALLGAGGSLEVEGEGAAEDWEGLLFHVRALGTAAEDLAAAIYPPQDPEELASAAEAVVNGCELICEETPIEETPVEQAEGAGGRQAQEVGAGAPAGSVQALAAALARVQEAHGQLAADLGEAA